MGQQPNYFISDSSEIYLQLAKEATFKDTEKAISYLNKSESYLSKSIKKHSKELLADILLTKGRIYYVKGEYAVSYRAGTAAYQYYTQLRNEYGKARALNCQGLVLQAIGNHARALELFKSSLDSYDKSPLKDNFYAVYVNIAISLIEKRQYKDAKTYLNDVWVYAKRSKDYHYQHLAYNKLGSIACLEQKYEEAIDYFSLVITDKAEPTIWEKAFAYTGIAGAYEALGKTDAALKYGSKGLEYAKVINAKWDLQQSYDVLFKIEEDLGNYKKALQYNKLAEAYKDSLYNQIRINQLDLLEMHRDEDERKTLIAENKYKDITIKRNNIIIIFSICSLLFLTWIMYQNKKRITIEKEYTRLIQIQNEEVEAQNETIQNHNKILVKHNQAKDKLISVFSHDLRAPIISMEQLLELMVDGEFTEEETKDLLEELLLQVRSTSFMLNDLLKWAKMQLDGLEVNPVQVNIVKKVEVIISSFNLSLRRKEITIVHTPEELEEPYVMVDEAHVNIILHNLIANAIKYTDVHKSIKVTYTQSNQHIIISVLNEGIVISDEMIAQILGSNRTVSSEEGTMKEKGEGLGLLLIKRFISVNNCELDIKSYKGVGSEFLVTLPKFIS
ncbi:hypothetical protein Y10_33180 [Neptunitalea sp. Y10]|uniref:histidine kinase n=1 Tax=Neptunitalea lumnitzerae TaxID=2965509 RepID=A0ABQ5MNH9_9FLAO|nr:hypothetical protein Y10_33180 [Neptunitalea sp. Y10]